MTNYWNVDIKVPGQVTKRVQINKYTANPNILSTTSVFYSSVDDIGMARDIIKYYLQKPTINPDITDSGDYWLVEYGGVSYQIDKSDGTLSLLRSGKQ